MLEGIRTSNRLIRSQALDFTREPEREDRGRLVAERNGFVPPVANDGRCSESRSAIDPQLLALSGRRSSATLIGASRGRRGVMSGSGSAQAPQIGSGMLCTRQFARVALSTVLLAAAGCTGGSTGSAPTAAPPLTGDSDSSLVIGGTAPAETVPGLSEAEAAELLATFDVADPVAFSILAEGRRDPAVIAAAAKLLADGATADERWAATYVWVNEGGDPEPLLKLLQADDATIRVMAATGLLARGRSEGFQPLITLLIDDSLTPGHPPSEVWRDAVVGLARYTAISKFGPPFDASSAQRADAAVRWQAWFDERGKTLAFDAEVGLWLAG